MPVEWCGQIDIVTPSVGIRDFVLWLTSKIGALLLKAFAAGSEFLPCTSMTFPAGCELNLIRTLRAAACSAIDSEWNSNKSPAQRQGCIAGRTIMSACRHELPGRRSAAGRGRGHPLRHAQGACRARRVACAAGSTALGGGGCDDIVVVLGAAVVDVPPPARAVIADDWADGLQRVAARGPVGHRRRVRGAAHGRHPRRRRRRGATGAGHRTVVAVGSGPRPLRRATRPSGRGGAHGIGPNCSKRCSGDEGARPFLGARTDVVAVDCADLASGHDIDVS